MAFQLRPYQSDLERDVYARWAAGDKDVLAVSATGSGKTVLFAKFLNDCRGFSVAVAHRMELVSQMSLTLARNGVRHRVIGPPAVQSLCRALHRMELQASFVDQNSRVAVAGVDSLPGYHKKNPSFFLQVSLVVTDEAHHLLKENKWGKARALFVNALGLGVTATAGRPDRKGLGRKSHGVFDSMVLAPEMREIIEMGFLTDYTVICPDSDVDISDVQIGASGELVQVKLAEAVHRSNTLVGDVVREYKRHASGKLGITFAVDIAAGVEITRAYNDAGVPAALVTGETPDLLRQQIIARFRRRELLQLVNVDLFGEGFDLPAIEVVSMARPTASFITYAQQFGRVLRLLIDPETLKGWNVYNAAERRYFISISTKPRGLVIDHVGNLVRHGGPPDKPRAWSLNPGAGGRGKSTGLVPYRVCTSCVKPFERDLGVCPWCDEPVPAPAARSTPAQVEGNLAALSDEAMAALRRPIDQIAAAPKLPVGAGAAAVGHVQRQHWEKQNEQERLRKTMQLWSGAETHFGRPGIERQWRRFYFTFGVDVATAMGLARADAEALRLRVEADLIQNNIDATVNLALP